MSSHPSVRLVGLLVFVLGACGDDAGVGTGDRDAGGDGNEVGGDAACPPDCPDADVDAFEPQACEPRCPTPAVCDESGAAPVCLCPDGFDDVNGDGRTCEDIDECSDAVDSCGSDTLCVNTPGGFSCDCEVGAIWDGAGCVSITERRLAAGDQHICEVRNGQLWCWGANQMGQLGDGTTERRAQPTRALELDDVTTVAAGGLNGFGHTCALRPDGSLWCWGRSGSSQPNTEPVQWVPELGWEQIDLGSTHACGVKDDGTAWCWGANSVDQLGVPTVEIFSDVPVQVGSDGDWISVTTGDAHSCGLRDDGSAWCWGINQTGEIGDGTTDPRPEPVAVDSDAEWAYLDAGAVNTCGLQIDGSVWCWGSNTVGQLGTGETFGQALVPERVGSDGQWRRIEVGGGFTCGIRADGSLWCWGNLLGFATTTARLPRRVGRANDWFDVAVFSQGLAAGGFACAKRYDGTLSCWGLNDNGQLGIGLFGDKLAPARVDDQRWQFVEARSFRTWAIRDDGTLWQWGSTTTLDGMLEVTQVPIQFGTQDVWRTISAGESYQCALRDDDTLWCWGFGRDGELGVPDASNALSPTQIGREQWRLVDAGGDFSDPRSCGIQADGSLWCWGSGSVGDGTREDRDRPTRIGEETDWLQVSVGESVCGLRETGELYCWGDSEDVPTRVGEQTDWIAIEAGLRDTCGIRDPGTLWCWDRDEPSQLGNGDDWWLVDELQFANCALRGEGELWCWGTDLGLAATGVGGANALPTRVGEQSDWTAVSMGGLHACGLRGDGELNCWGEGSFGRLGQGDAWREAPVIVE